MNKQKSVAAATLGCKVNFYETEAMLESFLRAGYDVVEFSEQADIYIVNTCTVTNTGDKKSRSLIRRAAKTGGIVVAVGCYVQAEPELVSKIENINLLIGTNDRSKIVEIVEEYIKKNEKSAVCLVEKVSFEKTYDILSISKMKNRQRAFVKIQDGCGMFCSYCIIPYVRGPVRSRELSDIIYELKTLVNNGFKEIVLTGIHLSSYGKDNHSDLIKVLTQANEIEGLKRIRLGSLEPGLITDEFVAEISKLSKFCDHFHLSLQSGCDNTLKNMNRKYTKDDFFAASERIFKTFQDAAITTDVIVGFPGETDEEFWESAEFCKKVGFAKIHVFPFSAKKGTVAAKMTGQIPKKVKEDRAKTLISISHELSQNFCEKFIGRELEVLIEKKISDHIYIGHTKNYIAVSQKSELDISNEIVKVKLEQIDGEINNFDI